MAAIQWADGGKPKKWLIAALFVFLAVLFVTILYSRRDVSIVEKHQPENSFKKQRDTLSRELNKLKMLFGQQNCELMKRDQRSDGVSEFGGWCAEISAPGSSKHHWDKTFSTALSAYLAGKTVGSFGEGPGAYKTHMDTLGQVTSYTAYDGAPFVESVTDGKVKFLDLTSPQYGLPIFDWVISVEVGEHIPPQFEDIYLDNLVRHAREGLILSWGKPGQMGLSHVNNKPLTEVIAQLNKRGFHIVPEDGQHLREAASVFWLKDNIQVYKRTSPSSLVPEDA
ncbi:uncharacterized protein LOC131956751 [Physella acuta]|uniref:uncharacterized protein LOC131956751 n=1 Tax=Physella acuta TaxID=109671 RepID=UPI0027DE9429|nr:uncharacterized protein LOC131956751 [Physella acuta]